MRLLSLPLAACLMLIVAPVAEARSSRGNGGDLERLRAADANGDGAVSRAELIASRTSAFARFDRNKDGFVAENDVPGIVRSARGAQIREMIEGADRNGDAKLTQAEFTGAPSPLFDRIDANDDNVASAEELAAARNARQN